MPYMRSSPASRLRHKQVTQREEKRVATSPSVFSFAHIALTAAITAVIALLLLVVMRSRFKMLRLSDCLLVAVVVGLSVIVWRSVGNTGALNNDPIPGVSPNDVLCPLVTYLFIGFYAAFRPPLDARRFEQARVLLTLVSFVVNVVTI
jgi:hypothetical protein